VSKLVTFGRVKTGVGKVPIHCNTWNSSPAIKNQYCTNCNILQYGDGAKVQRWCR